MACQGGTLKGKGGDSEEKEREEIERSLPDPRTGQEGVAKPSAVLRLNCVAVTCPTHGDTPHKVSLV